LSCAQPSLNTASSRSAPTKDDFEASTFDENPLRWELISDQDQIKIYHDIYAAPGRVDFKAKTTVNASIEKVVTALTDFDVRMKWLDALVENRAVKPISDFQRVDYAKIKAGYPFQFIDFVYRQTFSVIRLPRMLQIRMASTNEVDVPLPANTIRGQLINSYDSVRQLDGDHTEVVIEMGLDPKAAFPSWQSQKIVSDWFERSIKSFRGTVENPKFKVAKSVMDYIRAHNLD
jgi:hypothetical protein